MNAEEPIAGAVPEVPYGTGAYAEVMAGVRDRLAGARGVCLAFAGTDRGAMHLAAGELARRLSFPLHEVDLATLLDDDFARTEGNLRETFDTAKAGGVVLCLAGVERVVEGARRDPEGHGATVLHYLSQRIGAYRGVTVLFLTALPAELRDRIDAVVRFGAV